MPAAQKPRIKVTIDHLPLATLGIDPADPDNLSSYTIAGCVTRYAALVEQAAAELDAVLTRAEWNLIAESLNGCADLSDLTGSPIPALTLILAEVQDAHRLNRLGEKWLLSPRDEKLPLVKARALADERAADLARRLAALTPTHAEAILAAVRWFWSHEGIDHGKEEWWTVGFRRAGAGAE